MPRQGQGLSARMMPTGHKNFGKKARPHVWTRPAQ
jgi:hypothetical protein